MARKSPFLLAAGVGGDDHGEIIVLVAIPGNDHRNGVEAGHQVVGGIQRLEGRPTGPGTSVLCNLPVVDIEIVVVVHGDGIDHVGNLLAGVIGEVERQRVGPDKAIPIGGVDRHQWRLRWIIGGISGGNAKRRLQIALQSRR